MIGGLTVKHFFNRKVNEDSYAFDSEKKIIVVADGITRDPKRMPVLPGSKTNPFELFNWWKFFKNYPNPSPAKKAADLFCETALDYMRDCNDRGALTIKKAFEEGNNAIHELNKNENPCVDFLENDFYGCVAAVASIQNGNLSLGYIADCGVAIADPEGNLVYKTKDEGPSKEISYKMKMMAGFETNCNNDEKIRKSEFRYPEGRRTVRGIFRNNPAEELAYGALTGESTAMHYVRAEQFELNPNESVAVYSDGLVHILNLEKFKSGIANRSIRELRNVCRKQVKTEGTLVVYFP